MTDNDTTPDQPETPPTEATQPEATQPEATQPEVTAEPLPFDSFDALVEQVEARFEDPEKRLIAANLAADMARLTAQAVGDPQGAAKEMGFVRAAAANLAATEVQAVGMLVSNWLANFVRVLILPK